MELKIKSNCVPERLYDLQDDNTVLLPFLAGSGRPKTTLIPLHLHRICATGFGGLPTPRPSCCALQVWPSARHFPSANTHEKKNAAIQVLILSQQIKCWGVSGRLCAYHALVQVWGGRGRLLHYCGWCSCAWGGSGLIFGQLWRICGYIECGWFRIWLASITAQENQHPPIKIHLKGFNGCIFIPLVPRLSTGPVHFCSPVSPPLAVLENCSMVRNTHKSPKIFLKMLHWCCHLICSNQPVPRTSTNNHIQVEASSSRTEGGGLGRRRRRRRRKRTGHQHGQTSDQPQSRVQQILNPGNLLRRLLPSSMLFSSDSHPSWKQSWTKPFGSQIRL